MSQSINQTYTIVLSEAQRAVLVELLATEDGQRRVRLASAAYGDLDFEKDNLAFLLDALKSLPVAEADTPKVIHGLCL